ncbi:MAG: hypothetical protein Q9160_000058 [Pyrenula sp. 1 TL-2023]
MSSSQSSLNTDLTLPLSFPDTPLTPPLTDEKAFTQAHPVIALFRNIQAGRNTEQQSWIEFQLTPDDYEDIEHQLRRDESLHGYVEDKIRYDYCGEKHRLAVRMPTNVHKIFVDGVEDAIRSHLKEIRNKSDRNALFAQKVYVTRSTKISFPIDDASPATDSKYEPDASFWHEDAQYPGIIIEVAYSQKKKSLDRLAENYLLDSDANVQVVVGLNIEYGPAKSRKATLSVWRAQPVNTADGDELRAVQVIADEAFRDDDGYSTNHPGLRLRLSDCACKSLTKEMVEKDEDCEINVSTRELCQYLAAAEKMGVKKVRRRDPVPPGFKKRKRSETPLEKIASDDEAKYTGQEERAAKRAAAHDPDYKTT